MFSAFSVASIRDAEAQAIAQVGDDALMQCAAAALAQVVLQELRRLTGGIYTRRVTILVGSGNNGGDGLFAGVRLAKRGVRVRAWRASERTHDAGWKAFLAAGGREVSITELPRELNETDLVIDAIVGIGGKAGLRGDSVDVASWVASSKATVVAVDLPSGVAPEPPFIPVDGVYLRATTTVTFGGRKLCHVAEPARSIVGGVRVIDIGLPQMTPTVDCWEPSDVAVVWPIPGPNADKYSRGVVGFDAGSAQYPGAGVMAVAGALKAGAGMVRFLGAAQVGQLVSQRYPNVVLAQGKVQSWVIGCGWGEQPYAAGKIAKAVASGLPVVIDADGLRYLPERLHESVLLTPHAGELARMLGIDRADVTADPLTAVLKAANLWNAVTLLKGATQFVAVPGDPVVSIAVPGPGWTAQAGSGDVLAGICGALLAAGLSPKHAALAGASIQALGAAVADAPVPPQDLSLPIRLLRSIDTNIFSM